MDMKGFQNELAGLDTAEHDRSYTKCGKGETLLG
jgi:hypothetical protein